MRYRYRFRWNWALVYCCRLFVLIKTTRKQRNGYNTNVECCAYAHLLLFSSSSTMSNGNLVLAQNFSINVLFYDPPQQKMCVCVRMYVCMEGLVALHIYGNSFTSVHYSSRIAIRFDKISFMFMLIVAWAECESIHVNDKNFRLNISIFGLWNAKKLSLTYFNINCIVYIYLYTYIDIRFGHRK